MNQEPLTYLGGGREEWVGDGGPGRFPVEQLEQLVEKTHAGRDWGQEEKGMTEDQMAGWHHKLDGSEFE